MSATGRPYRQHLPALALSIERYTEAVPSDGRWYLLQHGKQIGRYRSLNEARSEWEVVVARSGWKPPRKGTDAAATLRAESAERWARNRAG
jgi:hypothetical protein